MSHVLWTIGHSTRPIEAFVSLLNAYGIQQLVDVRTIPRSRHNPQFNSEALIHTLSDTVITYQHAAQLGGLRKPKKDSINLGWRNKSFRGYADYMQTEQFRDALRELIVCGLNENTAIMCAEAVPWRCHRSLIADAMFTNNWEVRHIMSETKSDHHQLTAFAKVEYGRLYYPKPEDDLSLFQ